MELFPPQAPNFAKGLADKVRTINLGLRVSVEGSDPSSADEVSWAELTEYTLTMISALQDTVLALAGYVDLLSAKLGELEDKTAGR